MRRQKRFRRGLANDHLLDVAFVTEQGQVVRFSVNLRRFIGGRSVLVERVDTHHGHLHRHVYRAGRETIRDLPEPPGGDYASALTNAIERMEEIANADHPE